MTDRPPSSPPPPQRGLRVLLDGVYSSEREGTGVSHYAATLARGLAALNHDVGFLLGAGAPATPDPLGDAVAVNDHRPEPRGARQKIETAKRMLAGLSTGFVEGRRIAADLSAAVGVDSAQGPGPFRFLVPHLYVNAHYRQMFLRQFTQVTLPETIDVLHLTAPLPVHVKGARMVTTIHDLVPIRLPWTTPDNKAEFIARVRTCVAISEVIVTVSEASKADIVNYLQVDPQKVSVTYQPTDLTPLGTDEAPALERTLARYGLQRDGYALFVGALEPKKNLRRIIEAFVETDAAIPLVIVGRKAWMWEQELGGLDHALGEKARQRLRFIGYAARDDLRRLYAGAMMLLFPSLYEGFGLPPLEAMTMGCPVLTSSISSLPEICGDAALYVDPLDRDAIRLGIERLMGDPALRIQLAAQGRIQAARFSFAAYVARLKAVYDRFEP